MYGLIENSNSLETFDKIKSLIKGDDEKKSVSNLKDMLHVNSLSINYTDEYGNTLLHYACRERKYKIIKSLLNDGANPSITNDDGKLPIHFAAIYGSKSEMYSMRAFRKYPIRFIQDDKINKIFDILLNAYPISIGIEDKNGNDPFDYFIIHSNLSDIRILHNLCCMLKCNDNLSKEDIYKM